MKTAVITVIGALVIAGLGVGGYFVGKGQAPSDSEAAQAHAEAAAQAAQAAEEEAFDGSRARGESEGRTEGRTAGDKQGTRAGHRDGQAAAEEELAAASEPATPAEPGLVYDEQLPNGRPGYILPEDQRSIACIGIDAATGECVGD